MAQLPTVDDVAERAGVSRQTVSNVLNAPEIVRETTRMRVQSAIDELGYRPHATARRLRTQQSSTIGVRLDPMSKNGISGSILDRYLHALAEQADSRGMRIMLFTAHDDEAEIAQYERLRDAADVDAFVLTGTSYNDPRIEWLARERVPFVAFGRPWGAEHLDDPERLWVDVDGQAGVRMATEQLIGRGLRRIGYLGWPSGSGTGDDRRRGWLSAMTAAFASDPSELDELTIVADEGVPTARIAIEQLVRDGIRLDGLVCASDSLALGAMMAVREAGLPHFPIFGFDNTPTAQAVGLSSVDQRLRDVAAGTFELLMGATGRRVLPHGSAPASGDGGDDPRHRLITPQLVVRRSSHLELVEDAGGTESGDHDHRKEQS